MLTQTTRKPAAFTRRDSQSIDFMNSVLNYSIHLSLSMACHSLKHEKPTSAETCLQWHLHWPEQLDQSALNFCQQDVDEEPQHLWIGASAVQQQIWAASCKCRTYWWQNAVYHRHWRRHAVSLRFWFYFENPSPPYPFSSTLSRLRPLNYSLLHQSCNYISNIHVSNSRESLSFGVFLEVEIEHTKNTNISVLHTILNTMQVFLYASNDEMGLKESRPRRISRDTAQRINKHLLLNTMNTGPVFAIAPLQDSSPKFHKSFWLQSLYSEWWGWALTKVHCRKLAGGLKPRSMLKE